MKGIAEKMNVDTFEQFISDIATEKLPKIIPAKALQEQKLGVMVPYSEVVALKAALSDRDNRIKQLTDQLGKVKNGEQHQRKKARILEAEKVGRQHDDKHNAGVPIGIHGKAKNGCCQLCKNAGLGNRKHKGACDPKRLAESVAKLKAKKANKKASAVKTRRNHLHNAVRTASSYCRTSASIRIGDLTLLQGTC